MNDNESQQVVANVTPVNPPPPEAPKAEGVVFSDQQPAAQAPVQQQPEPVAQTPTSNIPEEFLTDEDLYPTSSAGSTHHPSSGKPPYWIFAIVGLLVLLAAIAIIFKFISAPPQSKIVKLTYWGLWDKESVMNEMINSYKKTHPNVQIDYTVLEAKDNYRERVIERTKKGTGPDIFRYHNTWIPQLREVLAPAPTSIVTADEYSKNFYPVINKDLVLNGSILGAPLYIDGLVLVYNPRFYSLLVLLILQKIGRNYWIFLKKSLFAVLRDRLSLPE